MCVIFNHSYQKYTAEQRSTERKTVSIAILVVVVVVVAVAVAVVVVVCCANTTK